MISAARIQAILAQSMAGSTASSDTDSQQDTLAHLSAPPQVSWTPWLSSTPPPPHGSGSVGLHGLPGAPQVGHLLDNTRMMVPGLLPLLLPFIIILHSLVQCNPCLIVILAYSLVEQKPFSCI